ncbi:MAG: cytochrome P450 [Leptospiraceae bacterium]|nr:cytochrome P450 [Leptospiraceae bacterium]MCP5493797.1 cytochrome P450 [Leptospiraceae bacterium]
MENSKIPKFKGWKAFKKSLQIPKDPLNFFLNDLKTYGDFIKYKIFHLNYYFIFDPDIIRYVLQENNSNYKKSIFYKELARLTGKGLIASEGKLWKKNRRLAQKAFKKSSIEEFSKIFYEEAELLSDEWNEKKEIDISKEMMKLTFQIVGRALFSANLDSYIKIMDENLSNAVECITKRATSYPTTIPYFIPNKTNRSLKKAIIEIDKIVNEIISNRISSKIRTNDLLDSLIYSIDEETGESMDPKQIRDETITFLFAGHETTSNALTWTFYLLSEHPEIRKKVIEEIKNNIPKEGRITIKDIEKLDLTSRVLKESMRLLPPVWIIERNSIGEDVLRGEKIPAGSIVTICTYAVHRNPKFWTNPDEFDPDRFLPKEESKRYHFTYIPFGAGPRVCIGNNFAFTEAMIILACLYRNHEPTLMTSHPVEMEPLVTLRPKYGMKMVLGKD